MAGEKDTGARKDFSGFKKRNVANDQILKPKHEQVEKDDDNEPLTLMYITFSNRYA